MIPKQNRFHGYNPLRAVYRRGETIRGPLMALKYTPSHKRESYRLGVVVSKKVSKSAVLRNRVRRRLYETVREAAGQITAPYDMAFIVYSDQLAELPAAELKQAVTDMLKQAGIIKSAKP